MVLSSRTYSSTLRREFKTIDIVKRINFIYPDQVMVEGYRRRPTAIFNPGLVLEGSVLRVYPRLQFEYYNYVACIGYFEVDVSELKSLSFVRCRIVVYPTLNVEYLGCEDPRVQKIGSEYVMLYTGVGATPNPEHFPYPRNFIWYKAHLCIAVSKDGVNWSKLGYVKMEGKVPVHDKDAFIVRCGDSYVLFHRPTIGNQNECWRGVLDLNTLNTTNNTIVIPCMEFEERVGWSTPPIEVDGSYLVFVHAKCVDLRYRVFACLLDRKTLEIIAMTPYYIMEPKELQEMLGDTAHVVYPCGAVKIDDKVIIAYGAADWCMGFGEVDLSELMHHLDRGRVM